MRVAAWQVVYPDVTVRHDPRCSATLSNLTLGTLRVEIREEDRQKVVQNLPRVSQSNDNVAFMRARRIPEDSRQPLPSLRHVLIHKTRRPR
jgi:hypothetical protein